MLTDEGPGALAALRRLIAAVDLFNAIGDRSAISEERAQALDAAMESAVSVTVRLHRAEAVLAGKPDDPNLRKENPACIRVWREAAEAAEAECARLRERLRAVLPPAKQQEADPVAAAVELIREYRATIGELQERSDRHLLAISRLEDHLAGRQTSDIRDLLAEAARQYTTGAPWERAVQRLLAALVERVEALEGR